MAERRGVFAEVLIGIFVAVVAGLIVWRLTTASSTSSKLPPNVSTSQENPTGKPQLKIEPTESDQSQHAARGLAGNAVPEPNQQKTLEPSKEELPTRPSATFPSGSWRGTLTQTGNAPATPVLMIFNGSRGGRFVLEALNCGGTFQLKQARAETFFFSYQYEYGSNCEPGGTVKIDRTDVDTLELTTFRSTGERMSWGTLKKIE